LLNSTRPSRKNIQKITEKRKRRITSKPIVQSQCKYNLDTETTKLQVFILDEDRFEVLNKISAHMGT
jgi:hypothetical protein